MITRTKYRNRKVREDGYTFDSAKEHNRYRELALLEAAGEIRDLKVHPRYELVPGFTHHSKRERAVVYEADFEYVQMGDAWLTVIEDVKGVRTAVYRLKRKLFLARYGDKVEFREV